MYCSTLVISPNPQNAFTFAEIHLVTKASVIAVRGGDKAKLIFIHNELKLSFYSDIFYGTNYLK